MEGGATMVFELGTGSLGTELPTDICVVNELKLLFTDETIAKLHVKYWYFYCDQSYFILIS